MKVTVYQGENFVLTNEHVLKQAAAQPLLTPVLVLVPDRFTLQAERLLLQYQPYLLNTRVVTFSMLYRLVSEEVNYQQTPLEVLDKTSAVLNLWKAIRQVQGQLLWFKNSAGHYDFAEKMFNTINQMRSSCVDFTTLEKEVTAPVAQKKYHDINLIYQAYCQIIAPRTDSSGMLEYLMVHAKESTVVQNAVIYVCGFPSLSPARLQVLDELCHTAKQVTIAASEKELSAQLSAYPHFQITAEPFAPQKVTVRAETERGEANIIIQQIVQLIAGGVKPESIVVLLNEFDTSAQVWEVVAQKYHLPVNLDVGTRLSTTAEAKYLRDLLELMVNDDAENTVSVLFNANSGIDDETAFALENQIVKSDLRASMVTEIKKIRAVKENVVAVCQELKDITTTWEQNNITEKLQMILDQMIQDFQNQNFILRERELINLFWTLCSATKVSNIPQYIDRVLIAPVNEWVPSRVEYLFVANCSEDNFPQGQSDDDILQEADLVHTAITPTPRIQRERNYRHVELLKSIPMTRLILAGTREEFTAVPYQPVNNFQWPAPEIYQSPITVGQQLFFPEQRVKTTLIEKFYDCPHMNFLQNGLKLNPRPINRLQANTVGSAIHLALQDYFTHFNLNQAIKVGMDVLEVNYPPLTENIAKEIKFILEKLDEIFQTGHFHLESKMEKPVERPLAHNLILVGRVDRLDVADLGNQQHAFMVLDFKTGNVAGSVAESIYLGNKLQLPVYSSALSKQFGRLAGAAYLPLSSGYATDEKKFSIKGFVDQEMKDLFPPALIRPRARYYLDGNTITRMCQYANNLVDQAVERILSGEVYPQAVHKTSCKYCPAKNLCAQFETNCRGDKLEKSITFKTFEEIKL